MPETVPALLERRRLVSLPHHTPAHRHPVGVEGVQRQGWRGEELPLHQNYCPKTLLQKVVWQGGWVACGGGLGWVWGVGVVVGGGGWGGVGCGGGGLGCLIQM